MRVISYPDNPVDDELAGRGIRKMRAKWQAILQVVVGGSRRLAVDKGRVITGVGVIFRRLRFFVLFFFYDSSLYSIVKYPGAIVGWWGFAEAYPAVGTGGKADLY